MKIKNQKIVANQMMPLAAILLIQKKVFFSIFIYFSFCLAHQDFLCHSYHMHIVIKLHYGHMGLLQRQENK